MTRWVRPRGLPHGLDGEPRHRRPRLHVGTVDASIARPREVYRFCLLANAAAVLLAHDHPSGNPEPSREDVAVTTQLVEAGRVMGVPVHDHLILTGDGYTSLAERGLV